MTDSLVAARGRVLVVDDVESNRYVLSTWLRREGYDVTEAATGREALDAVDADPPDVVVLDINLPDMTGYDICEYIKGHPRTSAVPVLHLSATAVQSTDRTEGLRRGADVFLVEPVERDELLASVHALLRYSAARRRAVRTAGRLRRLNEATLDLNAAGRIEPLLAAVVRGAAAVFQTQAIAAVMVDDRAMLVQVAPGQVPRITGLDPDLVRQMATTASAGGTVGPELLAAAGAHDVAGTWRVSALTDRSGEYQGALFVGAGTDAVPATGYDEGEPSEVDLVLKQFSQAVGIAITNVTTYNLEHRIAVTLQRSLLPAVLPRIPGVDVAARYEASAEHAEVGGDFYEIFELDADHVAMAVGDVVGHSLQAAAVMSQLRNGIRAYALEGHPPDAVLQRLNTLLLRFNPETTATVCYAVVERSSHRCEVANAGHPPPLLASGDSIRFLTGGGPLLGLEHATFNSFSVDLPDDSVLLFFTDGLFERRLESLDLGLQRVVDVVAAGHDNLERLCDRLLRDVGPGRGAGDDIAILAVRPRHP